MNEIEKFFDDNPVFGSVIVIVGIVVIAGVMLIGRSFTPKNGEVLTPQNWQIMNSRKAYAQELNELRANVLELSTLLNTGQPDPIQGQIVTEEVLSQVGDGGHSALYEERTAVSNAAAAVRSWTQGSLSYEDVQVIVSETIQLLQAAEIK